MNKGNHLHIVKQIKVEHLALLLLLAVSLVAYHLRYFEYLLLPLSAAIGALLFIVFRRAFASNELTLNAPRLSESRQNRIRLTLSILFFIFYGLSFLALLQGFYTKTVLYYVSIALCAGLIAIDVLFVNTSTQGHLNLLKSFLLVLNITLTNQILFPYGIGLPDSNYHIFDMTIPIISVGHIPLGYTYSSFPSHHILVAANSLISGVDPRMLYYCLGGFVMSLGLVFVFLIGRRFVNLKFGLFAALIYTCCDFLMSWASHPTHMTYTYFLAIAIFAITLYIYHKKDSRFVILFVILATAAIFAHHYSSVVMLIVLATMLLVELSYRVKHRGYQFRIGGLALLFVVGVLAHWMYVSSMMDKLVNIVAVYYNAFTHEAVASISLTTTFARLPLETLFLNEIGSGMLIMLSTIGFLHFFKYSSPFKKFVIALLLVFPLLMGIGILMKEVYFGTNRLYVFLQEFSLVFLGSCAIIWMLDNFKKLKPLPIILVMCLSFFSLASLIHGEETSIFKGDRAYWKLYETPYERYSANWAEQYIPAGSSISKSWSLRHPLSNIAADRLPINEVETPQGREILVIDWPQLPEDGFIIFSQFDIDIGFPYKRVAPGKYYMGGKIYARLHESEIDWLEEKDKLYDNGMVSIYK